MSGNARVSQWEACAGEQSFSSVGENSHNIELRSSEHLLTGTCASSGLGLPHRIGAYKFKNFNMKMTLNSKINRNL
jgi:hypothetical protein